MDRDDIIWSKALGLLYKQRSILPENHNVYCKTDEVHLILYSPCTRALIIYQNAVVKYSVVLYINYLILTWCRANVLFRIVSKTPIPILVRFIKTVSIYWNSSSNFYFNKIGTPISNAAAKRCHVVLIHNNRVLLCSLNNKTPKDNLLTSIITKPCII